MSEGHPANEETTTSFLASPVSDATNSEGSISKEIFQM